MKKEIEKRLVIFAKLVIGISAKLNKSGIGRYLGDQISRAGISSALNYGEAQNAESVKDFIHKLKVVLKELKETAIGLQIIFHANLPRDDNDLKKAMQENDELIVIIYKTIETVKENNGL